MNRGFFTSLNGEMLLTLGIPTDKWPEYITRHFLARDPETDKYILDPKTGRIPFVYDQVIYLYGTTCADSVGRVMTLAHELQHFVQYGFHRELHKRNFEFCGRLPAYEIPTEKEARITAKRIAEKLCGMEQVAHYIARKISDADSRGALEADEIKQWEDEAKDWRFIQKLDSSISYDLEIETERVRRRLAEH
jgi:Zn-dependent peptidase ImmA (M78 family)